jgi:hypothetical protein
LLRNFRKTRIQENRFSFQRPGAIEQTAQNFRQSPQRIIRPLDLHQIVYSESQFTYLRKNRAHAGRASASAVRVGDCPIP